MAKPKAPFSTRQRLVPQFGEISGGLLDGWSFAFVQVVMVKGRPWLDLRCQPKHWPFPKLVRVGMADYVELRNPGMVAKAYEMQQLIDAALDAAKAKQ